jgi:hypothetical protein
MAANQGRSDVKETADDWAIVVGISRYPGFTDLHGPENDALAFRDWLVGPGGVPEEQIQLLLSSSFPAASRATDAEPGVGALEKAFDRLFDRAEDHGMRAGRRLYIYLAGHGFEPEAEQAALFAANASRHRTGKHLAGKLFADWFRRAGLFDEVLLFMDCCREPCANERLRRVPYSLVFSNEAPEVGRWLVAHATKWSRKAREKSIGGHVRGVFTAALIAGLEGEAANEKGEITDESLGKYLYAHMRDRLTSEELLDPDIPKRPDISYDNDPANRILITRVPPRSPAVEIEVESGHPSVPLDVRSRDSATEITVLDGALTTVARALGNLRIDLPAGLYKVGAQAGVHVVERLVALAPGSEAVVVELGPIELPSPAPLKNTACAHEAHATAASVHSKGPHERLGQGSQIFVLARAFTRPGEARAELVTSELTLTDAGGKPVVDIAASGVRDGGADAWCACTVEVAPGAYRLRVTAGADRHYQPIIAAAGWQTQVFLLQRSDGGAELSFSDPSISYVRPSIGFDPGSLDARRRELARLALANGRRAVPDGDVAALVSGALEDPMLGLFTAHLMLASGKRGDERLKSLVSRLRAWLGAHPDVEALALLFPDERPAPPFASPPMLLGSWSLVLEESRRRPALVPPNAAATTAASRLWGTGPWLQWRESAAVPEPSFHGADLTAAEMLAGLREYGAEKLAALPDLTAAEEALVEQLFPHRRAAAVRPERARFFAPVPAEAPDVTTLCRGLGLPPSALRALLASLLGKADDELAERQS